MLSVVLPHFDWSDFPQMLNEVSASAFDELVVLDETFPKPLIPVDCSGNGERMKTTQDDDTLHFFQYAKHPRRSSRTEHHPAQQEQPRQEQEEVTTSKKNPKKKRVSFSTLEIREYSLTVGDHPACLDGLPLSLDWKYCDTPTILGIHPYETLKKSRKKNRRKQEGPLPRKLDFHQRLRRLQHVTGISEKHMLLVQNNRAWANRKKEL